MIETGPDQPNLNSACSVIQRNRCLGEQVLTLRGEKGTLRELLTVSLYYSLCWCMGLFLLVSDGSTDLMLLY